MNRHRPGGGNIEIELKLELRLDDFDDVTQTEDIDSEDEDDRDCQEPNRRAGVHPTFLILIVESEQDIGEHHHPWHDPAHETQHLDTSLSIKERLDEEHPEEDSLGQHPGVCGHHEVSGEDMESSAPDTVI